jgi:hypothetical protein
VGQRKGPSGENAPPVHGIKKCLVFQTVVKGHTEEEVYMDAGGMTISMNLGKIQYMLSCRA